MYELFNTYGECEVRLLTNRDTGKPKGVGFVEYGSVSYMKKAIGKSDFFQKKKIGNRTVIYQLIIIFFIFFSGSGRFVDWRQTGSRKVRGWPEAGRICGWPRRWSRGWTRQRPWPRKRQTVLRRWRLALNYRNSWVPYFKNYQGINFSIQYVLP